jgi:hypothetical protein
MRALALGLALSAGLLGGPFAPRAHAANTADTGEANPPDERHVTAAARQRAIAGVAEALLERAVRPVELEIVRTEAARRVDRLAPRRLFQLLRQGDAGALVEEQLAQQAAASSKGRVRSIAASALGDPESELLFVPLAPCRIIDTRLVSAGDLAAGETRSFHVAGTNAFLAQGGNGGGCGIPLGATEPVAAAVMINFVAVGPVGPGHLQAWEYGTPMPNAAILSYAETQPQLNIANGVIVPIAGTSVANFDLEIFAGVSATHVVADVTGYFTRFPLETLTQPAKSTLATATLTSPAEIGDGGCHRLTSCTVTTPPGVSGKVLLRFWAHVAIDHTNGTHDRVTAGTKLGLDNPPNCTAINDQVANTDFELPDVAPTATDVDATLTHGRMFTQSGGTTRTYSLLSNMVIGASAGDRVESARMTCMFMPD